MLDNMVVPQADGDIDVSMLKEAVDLINGRFETEVLSNIDVYVVTVLLVVVTCQMGILLAQGLKALLSLNQNIC